MQSEASSQAKAAVRRTSGRVGATRPLGEFPQASRPSAANTICFRASVPGTAKKPRHPIMRRALVMFVEDPRHLIAESSWLYESWKHIGCGDTDLVFMGTEHALGQLPEDVIKIVQRPAADDPEWLGYRFINSLACLNGEGALVLNDYDRLLRTDLDVFLTPAWNSYDPAKFSTGRGHYSNDDCVRDNIRRVAHKYGLELRGVFNVGSTMYGPPQLVREICDLATEVCKYIRRSNSRTK